MILQEPADTSLVVGCRELLFHGRVPQIEREQTAVPIVDDGEYPMEAVRVIRGIVREASPLGSGVHDVVDAPAVRTIGEGRDLLALRGDGQRVPVMISMSPTDSPEGPIVLVTLGDISERREAEQRLLEYAQELEMANGERRELDQLKSDFVAMASHELRTPLTSIAGFVKILLASRDARDDEAHRKYLEANARNYGRPPITVRITRTEAKVKISVTDSGDGIPRRLRPPPL